MTAHGLKRRASLVAWRDWNLRTKLAAVTLVPLLFAIALGALQIHDQVARADSYRRVDRLVTLNDQLHRTVGGLQQERGESARLLAGPGDDLVAELRQEYQVTDVAWAAMSKAASVVSFMAPAASSRVAELGEMPGRLATLRGQVVNAGLDAGAALTRYGEIVAVLLAFDQTLSGEIADLALAGTATALHDLQMAGEEVYLQQTLVSTGLARGLLTVADLGALRGSVARLDARIADFRATASPAQQLAYLRTVSGAGVDNRVRLLAQVLEQSSNRLAVPGISAADWQTSSQLTTGALATISGALGRELNTQSVRLQNEASDAAGVVSVVLFAAMLLAAFVMIMVTRQLLASLRILRRSALAVADRKLPEAVAGLRAGVLVPPDVEPVPVRTADEFGQVARAFDAVQDQALRLAAEQAHLRASYGEVFVNLSRRSQGLVQRQLHLLDRLERDEEDPDQLATLFQLDHLATRMRRNNENLMVLSAGSELARRAGQPVQLADMLRAAVSEIEQYQRVMVQPPPALTVVGYAARDLVRLTAELLDNATAFSAPETKVTIASRLADDGSVSVDVLDTGIGMRDEELAEVNARLAEGGQLDASASRRMGLFVVGRLASRHGVRVELHGGKDIAGVRATMTIPADLLMVAEPEQQQPPVRAKGAADTTGANGHSMSTSNIVGRLATGAAPVGRMRQPAPVVPDSPAGLSNDDLFGTGTQPVEGPTGWWEPVAAPAPPAERGIHETTPIFDEMLSAWFTDDVPTEDGEAVTETWEFAADKGFEAAQVVTEAPLGVTTAGLPQRVPREKLVPGSVADEPPSVAEIRGQRAAEVLRDRLSGLQQGLNRARDSQDLQELRKRVISAADKGFQSAQSATKSPEGVTPAGLPQRVAQEKLVPGSIEAPPGFGDGLVRGGQGAQEVRGRLDELRRGLGNARRNAVVSRPKDDRKQES